MRMITAEENPSRGNIKIGKHDIESNSSEGFQYLGYCPQFDAVWRKITVREHLETYAAIRGVAAKDIKRFLFLLLLFFLKMFPTFIFFQVNSKYNGRTSYCWACRQKSWKVFWRNKAEIELWNGYAWRSKDCFNGRTFHWNGSTI